MTAIQWTPHEYQQTAVRWLLQHTSAALLADPGLGKTSIALSAFAALKRKGKAKRLLVVAPLRVAALVWTQGDGGELSKWSDFADLKVSLIHGPEKQRIAACASDADIYVINYDGLAWLCGPVSGFGCPTEPPIAGLLRKGVDVLCFDEVSKMKHTRTRRFKALKPWLARFPRRWGLTGSPVANGLLDLFGQVYALDLGQRLGRFVTQYRFAYFLATGYGGYTWQPKPGAQEQIYKRIGDLALSMRAEDHLDLPDLIEQNIWVDLPPKVRKVYDDMEDELVAMLDSGEVTAANAAVASGKCRQIASGGLYVSEDHGDEARRRSAVIHHAKTEALVDLVEELQGNPLLVGYEFHHDLERIREKLGDVPAINGGMSLAASADLALRWNAGELPVLCGHPAAMAHGINLQACGHHIAWYSLTWNFELYDQFIRRVYRQGQKNRVFVHRILARDTVDDIVLRTLARKERGQVALFEELRKIRGGAS